MKTLVFGHAGIGYRVADRLFDEFVEVAKGSEEYSPELEAVTRKVVNQGKPFIVDYVATGEDDILEPILSAAIG